MNIFNRIKVSQLAIGLGIFLVSVIIISAFATAMILRNQEIELWRKQLSNHTLTLAEHTYQTMTASHNALDGIAERVRAEGADSPETFRRKLGTPEIHQMLKNTVEFLPQVDVATIVANNGDVINFTRSYPAPPINLADRDYFKAHAKGVGADNFVSIAVRNKGNGKWVFYISHRINDSHGSMMGLVLIGISVESFTSFYEQLGSNLGNGASLTLYRRDFTMLTRWPLKPELIGKINTIGTAYTIIEKEKKDNDVLYIDAPRFSDDNRKVARLGAVRLVRNYPLIVNIAVTEDFFLANWHYYVKWIVAASLGAILTVLTSIAVIIDLLRRRDSERKQAEEERHSMELQMLQAQKLESLGVLAGGIAHDFNNILMAIMGNAELALMRIHKESPAADNLKRIEQSAARAADLAKQMLAYSGKGKFVIEHLDMSRLVKEMLNMMEVSISKKAALRLNLTSPIPSVEADATQLRQIIMNLVINASEAIGEKSGVIAINTGCMECDINYLKSALLNENLGAGLYVFLEVSDTGCGMDSKTLAKLFDPFFTTKFTGRGLGMAAVLGIVRGHKGAIRIYSEPDKGSSFKILLPASSDISDKSELSDLSEYRKGSGTVLLVDDEETIRTTGSDMLRELGFQVVTAEDGRDALEICKSRDDIEIVILDLTMPKMDGEQCFRELRQLKPELKVIMSSGFNQQEVTQKFVGEGLYGFIQKPYRLSALMDVLNRPPRF